MARTISNISSGLSEMIGRAEVANYYGTRLSTALLDVSFGSTRGKKIILLIFFLARGVARCQKSNSARTAVGRLPRGLPLMELRTTLRLSLITAFEPKLKMSVDARVDPGTWVNRSLHQLGA